MSSPGDSFDGNRFDLSASDASLILEDAGFRLRVRSGAPAQLVSYEEVTHLGVSQRGLWLGLRRTVVLLRRNRFRTSEGPERLARTLVTRIAQQRGGTEQLGRFASIDHLVRRPSRRLASTLLALVCVAVFVLQMRDRFVIEAGAFVPGLVEAGELWRVFTAHLLHAPMAVPLHLVMNLLALLGFSFLVERPLGALRTVVLMGVSAVAAMVASAMAGYAEVIGASGIVAGMAGAAFCLEIHYSHLLPAWWRIPRRIFVIVLLAEAVYGFVVPSIAGAAHLGGFVGGYAATYPLARSGLARMPTEPWVRATAAVVLAAAALSVGAAASLVARDGDALARYGRDLLTTAGLPASRYNDLAWRMATEMADASPGQLEVALDLAEHAVEETERRDPDLLDTLAEVFFARGERDLAVDTIDEAIDLAPLDEYFREQRRRFTGERAADDRPDPPSLPWPFRRPPELHAPELEDGIAI